MRNGTGVYLAAQVLHGLVHVLAADVDAAHEHAAQHQHAQLAVERHAASGPRLGVSEDVGLGGLKRAVPATHTPVEAR